MTALFRSFLDFSQCVLFARLNALLRLRILRFISEVIQGGSEGLRYAIRSNFVNGFIYVIGIYINIIILKESPVDGFGFTPQQIEIGVIIAAYMSHK